MKTDIEIARSVNMRRITDVAEDLGIPEEKVAQYGHYMAKVPLSLIDEEKITKSKLILVTAITATKTAMSLGEYVITEAGFSAIDLVVETIENNPSGPILFTYNDDQSIKAKIEAVAKKLYGAANVTFASAARSKITAAENMPDRSSRTSAS